MKNMIRGRLDGKIAIVTSAGSGLGEAIARKFAREGARVVVNGVVESSVNAVVDGIRAKGGEAIAFVGNISEESGAAACVQCAVDEWGGLDILVNNAGVTQDNLLIRMKIEQWREVLDVNLSGAFYCTKAAARPMLKNDAGGRIINISSVIGQMGNAGQANYAASKAGLLGLTKSLAKELGSRAITVNAIAPGFIVTDMTAELSDEAKSALLGQIPLGTLGQAEDVAELALFLASGKARYITGQTFNVDGGLVME